MAGEEKGEEKKSFHYRCVGVRPWKGFVAVWLSVYLIPRQVVGWGGARKDDGGLAGKPKKIRSAAVDGGEETEETEEALTDVK